MYLNCYKNLTIPLLTVTCLLESGDMMTCSSATQFAERGVGVGDAELITV